MKQELGSTSNQNAVPKLLAPSSVRSHVLFCYKQYVVVIYSLAVWPGLRCCTNSAAARSPLRNAPSIYPYHSPAVSVPAKCRSYQGSLKALAPTSLMTRGVSDTQGHPHPE